MTTTTLPAVPILDGRRSDCDAYLLVWCQHCQRSHRHSRHRIGTHCTYHWAEADMPGNECTCPVGAGDGYRVAPCGKGSPYASTGYVVREVVQHRCGCQTLGGRRCRIPVQRQGEACSWHSPQDARSEVASA